MKTNLFDMVDKDNIFTAITADQAVEYTGKEVYVANSITALEQQIKEGFTHTLEGINSNLCELRFNVHRDDCTTDAYALCVPADKVHKIKKQLRPFNTMNELHAAGLSLGNMVTFRFKNNDNWYSVIVTAIGLEKGKFLSIVLGNDYIEASDLLDSYEYSKDEGETWLPFGIEE